MPELSWKHFEGALAGGTTLFDRSWELNNPSEHRMHVTIMRQGLFGGTAAPGESATVFASKRNTLAGIVNDDEEWVQEHSTATPPTGATPADGGLSINDRERYLEGELIIEPGKSIYGHHSKSSDPVLSFYADIGYFLEK